MNPVVVTTPDVVGRRMAGPGIRAYHFARELARVFPTTLIARFEDFDGAGEHFTPVDRSTLEARRASVAARVVVGQPVREILALSHPVGKTFVFDLFDPVVLELEELYRSGPTIRQRAHRAREWARLRMALARGDLLICGADRQRDFYAGVHAAAGGELRGWIDRWITIPFGIEDRDPGEPIDEPKTPRVVWGGGRWEWLDPGGAIEAVRLANDTGTRCRLLFLGGSRPNRRSVGAGADPEVERAIEREDGIVESNLDWVPYRERGRWLRASRIAIMLHRRTSEAEYSMRTRLFDALWCGLPVIATEGGFAAELVARESIGLVVRPESPDAVSGAIVRLLNDLDFHARCVANIERIRPRFEWARVTAPLVEAIRGRLEAR